ncbi:GTPase IMAP family member 4-like [Mercenaria mercenaria]|uniref:GTPase IMAP family member 4-like n=1 Tax=Mercenaria mercenaria TaxID=6596 RepID=UPI00234EDA6D|nr:GTPase IMAP family member 4-like [Mercenaria mercenaria]
MESIEVVDTPGTFDTHRPAHEIQKELIRSLVFMTPGFHAIVFVLEIGRFTEELEKTKDLFFDWFGHGVEKYACIILTKTEDKKTMDKYLSTDTTDGLSELIKRCGGKRRVAYINNKADKILKEIQVKQILELIEDIKQSNNNTHFSNVAFELATSYAYNKSPDRITQDSIHILQKAGVQMKLSDKECKMLDKVFEIEGKSGDPGTGSDFVEQKPRVPRSQRTVDLNTVCFTPMTQHVRQAQSTRNTNNSTCSSDTEDRKNQYVDDGTEDTDPLNELKDDINKGRKNEENFFKHLKDAFILGKRKFKCTLL